MTAAGVRCPYCGTEAPAPAVTCSACGGRLPEAAASPPTEPRPAPPTAVPVPSTAATADTHDTGVAATCWSCGGPRSGAAACPWCGAAGPVRALTAEEAAEQARRRRAVVRRASIVAGIVIVAAGVVTAGAFAWQNRQRDNDWKKDRLAAANTTVDVLRGLPLDPSAPDPDALQAASAELATVLGELYDAEGHQEDRNALGQSITEFQQAIDGLADVADQPLSILDEDDVARARIDWGALGDDVDTVFELTGVRIDIDATRAKVTAFIDELRRRADAEQRRHAAQALKAHLVSHREQVERLFAEYEALRADFGRQGIAEVETSEYFTPFDVTRALEEAAEARAELADELRAVGGPTSGLTGRVQRMADLIDEQAALLDGVDALTGPCRFTQDFQYVCPRIGELPRYKSLVSDTNAVYQRLVEEKRAWVAEVDSETAKADQQLATA